LALPQVVLLLLLLPHPLPSTSTSPGSRPSNYVRPRPPPLASPVLSTSAGWMLAKWGSKCGWS
jgi:hypothetical protein